MLSDRLVAITKRDIWPGSIAQDAACRGSLGQSGIGRSYCGNSRRAVVLKIRAADEPDRSATRVSFGGPSLDHGGATDEPHPVEADSGAMGGSAGEDTRGSLPPIIAPETGCLAAPPERRAAMRRDRKRSAICLGTSTDLIKLIFAPWVPLLGKGGSSGAGTTGYRRGN